MENTSTSPPPASAPGPGSPFRLQYLACRAEGFVGINEGPEEAFLPAFPSEAVVAKMVETGAAPKFRRSTCKRFGGFCSSGNVDCRKLRGMENIEFSPSKTMTYSIKATCSLPHDEGVEYEITITTSGRPIDAYAGGQLFQVLYPNHRITNVSVHKIGRTLNAGNPAEKEKR